MTSKLAFPIALAILLASIWTGALLLGDYLSKDFIKGPLTAVPSNTQQPSAELSQLISSIEQHPDDIPLRLKTALALLEEARSSASSAFVMQAIDHLRHVLKLEPKHSQTLKLIAEISFDFGVFDKAAGYFARYLDIEPQDSQATIDYSLSLIQTEQSATAVVVLEALCQQEPQSFPAHLSLALAQRTAQQIDKARVAAKKAATLATNEQTRQAAQRFIQELEEVLAQEVNAAQ